MGWVSGYVFILPAATIAGWALSWWGPPQLRWWLPVVAAAVSVVCIVIGIESKGPPVTPETAGCSPLIECMDPHPLYWIEAGMFGFACCIVLLLITIVVEFIQIAWEHVRS